MAHTSQGLRWQNSGIGLLLLRLFTGSRLIYGTADNIFSWERMKEFEAFLAAHHFPLPIVSAVVSVYAQFICGILFIVGWQIRWAAAIMIINFLIAASIHLKQGFEAMTPPLAILFSSFVFLFEGAGTLAAGRHKGVAP